MNLYKRPVRKFQRAQYQVSGKDDIWAADLVDYSTDNGNNKGYILVCVDMFTRKVYTYVMKTKTEKEISLGLKTMFNHAQPRKIHSDQESGLIHNKFLRNLGIPVYHTKHSHAYLAETNIRTIKGALEKIKDSEPFRVWKPYVEKVTEAMNNKKNPTTKLTPNAAQDESKQLSISERMNKNYQNIPQRAYSSRYKVGDYVLTAKPKSTFHKGYRKQWNEIPFMISEVWHGLRPIRYSLQNLVTQTPEAHKYYHEELQKISYPEVKGLFPKERVQSAPQEKKEFVREEIITRSKKK